MNYKQCTAFLCCLCYLSNDLFSLSTIYTLPRSSATAIRSPSGLIDTACRSCL